MVAYQLPQYSMVNKDTFGEGGHPLWVCNMAPPNRAKTLLIDLTLCQSCSVQSHPTHVDSVGHASTLQTVVGWLVSFSVFSLLTLGKSATQLPNKHQEA